MKYLILLPALILYGCGALQPKFYPQQRTIISTLFPSEKREKIDPEFEKRLQELFAGNKEIHFKESYKNQQKKKFLFDKSKLLIINSLTGLDTDLLVELKKQIREKNTVLSGVEFIAVSSLPNLSTLRLMGARQGAQYVLILNSFSNAYRYHNAWTVPAILGLGIPYFFLDTQTIKIFAKVEYSLIDIKENIVLSNDSVTTKGESNAILPESGIVQFETENESIERGFKKLSQKFLEQI